MATPHEMLLAVRAAVLTTVFDIEQEHGICPKSPLYLGLGSDMGIFEEVLGGLAESGDLEVGSSTVRLTPQGVNTARVMLESGCMV